VLQILFAFPINLEEEVVMQKLKASGLMKIVMFLANLPMETNANQKLAKELVEKWSRGDFGISDKFEDLKMPCEEQPKPIPPKKEEGIRDRLNGKLKKLKKKNKFLSIQERHHQMKREKLRKGTC
jgi:hypothetical protein